MQLDLVDRRGEEGQVDDVGEVFSMEVAHADGPGVAVLLPLHQAAPAVDILALLARRPVDQVQIDVVQPEPLEADLQRILGRLKTQIRGRELGSDEQFLTGDARRGDRPAHRFLIAVGGRGVDQPVAGFQRRRHGLLGLGIRQLTDAEADHRDRVLVVESDGGNRSRRRHGTYPVKLNVRGSGPSRVPSPSEEMDAMSCSLSSKSNTSKLLTIRSGVTDFGMTILPSWICHLISTCAGVFPCASATAVTVGSSSSAPWPSGAHASVAMPICACTFRSSSCGSRGLSSIWLTAGTIPVASTRICRCSGSKLLTPIDDTRPWSCRCANALKVSTNVFLAGIGQWIRYRSRRSTPSRWRLASNAASVLSYP